MAKVKTNVRVVANAIRANGYKQIFGSFDDGKGGACALGQAAKNLHVSPSDLQVALNGIRGADGLGLGSWIINFNDEARWPLDKIADRIERDWASVLDEPVTIS